MKYMVAIDGSQNAKDAFETALMMMNPKEDELFIITVAERFALDIGPLKGINHKVEQTQRGFLSSYNAKAKERGFKPHCILGKAGSVGELLCQAVEKKKIDFLVLGRRGMSRGKRLLAGSVSKHVMEHADCNVIVVKGNYLPEQHDSLNHVLKMEEAERRRREGLDDESRSEMEKEKAQREAEHIGAVVDEEEERKRRIRYDTFQHLKESKGTEPTIEELEYELDKLEEQQQQS